MKKFTKAILGGLCVISTAFACGCRYSIVGVDISEADIFQGAYKSIDEGKATEALKSVAGKDSTGLFDETLANVETSTLIYREEYTTKKAEDKNEVIALKINVAQSEKGVESSGLTVHKKNDITKSALSVYYTADSEKGTSQTYSKRYEDKYNKETETRGETTKTTEASDFLSYLNKFTQQPKYNDESVFVDATPIYYSTGEEDEIYTKIKMVKTLEKETAAHELSETKTSVEMVCVWVFDKESGAFQAFSKMIVRNYMERTRTDSSAAWSAWAIVTTEKMEYATRPWEGKVIAPTDLDTYQAI